MTSIGFSANTISIAMFPIVFRAATGIEIETAGVTFLTPDLHHDVQHVTAFEKRLLTKKAGWVELGYGRAGVGDGLGWGRDGAGLG